MTNDDHATCDRRCPDGTHVIVREHVNHNRICRYCGVFAQTIYSVTRGAAEGDFRVVCAEPGCDYGTRTDANGNGYTNHAHIVLAKAALQDHQSEVAADAAAASDDPDDDSVRHAVKIQQHPCDAVVEASPNQPPNDEGNGPSNPTH